jgi:hypothetical protein
VADNVYTILARLLLTTLVVLVGLCALMVSIRWIARTDGAPWTTPYRRYRNIDQRRAAPIGVAVDTIYVAGGVANGADGAYWVGLGALVAVQAAMIAMILVVVHRKNGRRRTTS